MTKLTSLDVSYNSFQYDLPTNYIALQRLKILRVANNALTGSSANQILFGIDALEELDLSNNPGMNGEIFRVKNVVAIGHSRNLTVLDISHCQFTGQLNYAILEEFPIRVFRADGNDFFGTLPVGSEWRRRRRRQLQEVNDPFDSGHSFQPDRDHAVDWNMGTGLQSLSVFSASNNRFSGTFPWNNILGHDAALNLEYLDVSGNSITGDLPPNAIGEFTNLQYLDMSSNKLSSSIPSSIGQMTNLKVLNLQGNNLQGSLPAHLGNCTKLERLGLNSNDLTGTIPNELSNIPSLGK